MVIKLDLLEKLPDQPCLKAREACKYCDLMIIIGTSGIIPPASNLPWIAFKKFTTTIQINPEKTTFDERVTFNLHEKACDGMSKLYELAFGD